MSAGEEPGRALDVEAGSRDQIDGSTKVVPAIPVREFAYRLARSYRLFTSPLWVRIQRRLRFKIVSVSHARSGLRFRCRRGADRMFHETFNLFPYDIPLVPLRPGDFVIDIGANHGFAAIDFARRGANVLAFEPSPEVFRFLRGNVTLNGLDRRVDAHCVAITDRDGEAELFETPEMGGGMSSLEPRYVQATGVAVSARTLVPTRSIKSILSELGGRRVRLLKLDCEGSELKILRALDAEERAGIDSVALEYHPEVYEMPELVEALERWPEFEISKPCTSESPNLLLHLARRDVARAALRGDPGG